MLPNLHVCGNSDSLKRSCGPMRIGGRSQAGMVQVLLKASGTLGSTSVLGANSRGKAKRGLKPKSNSSRQEAVKVQAGHEQAGLKKQIPDKTLIHPGR